MGVAASVLTQLEGSWTNPDLEKHTRMLQRITALFVESADTLSEDQIPVFDEVLMHLIERIELKALIVLGDLLAPIDNAPTQVIRRLAFDEQIAVAGPVLARSKRLAESDLLQIAKSKGKSHLLAISARETLSAELTDVLVARGDGEVKNRLAKNTGARFFGSRIQSVCWIRCSQTMFWRKA
jgi:uncharacterized protein (DUF2336 family)